MSYIVQHKPKRNSSIELLRIISMMMIVLYHFAVHGDFNFNTEILTIPKLWYNLIAMGGKIGVDIFVLISGYFLISDKEKSFNFKRIFKFWGQVFFYSITILIFYLLFNTQKIHLKPLIKSLLPITFSEWWFASAYFILYIIHPFLNKFLNNLEKQAFQKFLILLVIFFSILPTFTTLNFQINELVLFIFLYSIAAYIRLYGLNPKLKSKDYLKFWIIFSTIEYLSSLALCLLGTKWPVFEKYSFHFYAPEAITTLLISLSIFMFFLNLNIQYHKLINTVASASFGVYLIHDNEFARQFLWLYLFKNANFQDSLMIIPYSIIVVLIVYTCCSLIDLLRQATIEKLFIKFLNQYLDNFLSQFSKLYNKVRRIIFGI